MPGWNGRKRPPAKRVKANIDGSGVVNFRSKGERDLAEDMHRRGVQWDYEQTKLSFMVKQTYILDFDLKTKSGNTIFIEYKGFTPGWEDGSDRTKILRAIADFPIDLRIIWDTEKFANSRIRKGSKTTNAEWADKNGIKHASQFVPQEWLDE